LFDEAIASGLANEVVFNNKGAALDALGRNEEAVECYKKATYINDKYELAWHNLGNSLFIQEHYWGAARAYTKATRLKSDRKENWSGLAASYSKLGRKRSAGRAIKNLDRFSSVDSSTILLQSDLYLDGGFSDEAVEKCNEYIALKPESVEGYARLGTVEHERGSTTRLSIVLRMLSSRREYKGGLEQPGLHLLLRGVPAESTGLLRQGDQHRPFL